MGQDTQRDTQQNAQQEELTASEQDTVQGFARDLKELLNDLIDGAF